MKKLRRITLAMLLTVVAAVILPLLFLPSFLSVYRPLETNHILIESWISAHELEQALRLYGSVPNAQFYLVGRAYAEPDHPFFNELPKTVKDSDKLGTVGVWLLANSSLMLNVTDELKFRKNDSIPVEVTLKGGKASGKFAHFVVVINGKPAGSDFAEAASGAYHFNWIASETTILSFAIRFNNDLKTDSSDRNLFVSRVKIGDHEITVTKNNSVITRETNRLTTGFHSQPQEVKRYLTDLGREPASVTTLSFHPEHRNQTLLAAKKLREFISKQNVSDINIVTYQLHSRRTRFTYNQILGDPVDVGVVYFTAGSNVGRFSLENYLHLLDEYASYLFIWFELHF